MPDRLIPPFTVHATDGAFWIEDGQGQRFGFCYHETAGSRGLQGPAKPSRDLARRTAAWIARAAADTAARNWETPDMCNHYRASGEWRTRMDAFSRTRIPLTFDWTAPRANVQADDVYPTAVGEILVPRAGRLEAAAATWLLMPWKAALTWAEWSRTRRGCNNARGEEADGKWPFKAAAANRVLIPGEAFFEWDDAAPKKAGGPGKSEFRFAYPDGRAFFFAGLANRVEPPDAGPMLTYAMVTKAAGGDTAAIGHPRQPIVLQPEEIAAWLDPANPIRDFAARLDPAGTFARQAVKGPRATA